MMSMIVIKFNKSDQLLDDIIVIMNMRLYRYQLFDVMLIITSNLNGYCFQRGKLIGSN